MKGAERTTSLRSFWPLSQDTGVIGRIQIRSVLLRAGNGEFLGLADSFVGTLSSSPFDNKRGESCSDQGEEVCKYISESLPPAGVAANAGECGSLRW